MLQWNLHILELGGMHLHIYIKYTNIHLAQNMSRFLCKWVLLWQKSNSQTPELIAQHSTLESDSANHFTTMPPLKKSKWNNPRPNIPCWQCYYAENLRETGEDYKEERTRKRGPHKRYWAFLCLLRNRVRQTTVSMIKPRETDSKVVWVEWATCRILSLLVRLHISLS